MKRTDWTSPLSIPEGRSGAFEIKHETVPAGEPVMMGSLRTRMFGQDSPGSITFDHPTTWHHLLEDGLRWMCDWPVEQRQCDECLKGFRGNVLVGGLGLGYAAQALALMPRVKSVTVVEIAREVADLVAPHLRDPHGKIEVIRADLLDYLKEEGLQGSKKRTWDRAFYDIWRSDGEGTFFDTVVPLHRLSRPLVKARPVCWGEDIMRGQLCMGLQSRLMFLTHPEVFPSPDGWSPLWEEIIGPGAVWHNWAVEFFQWWKHVQPTPEVAKKKARIYAGLYGLAGWRRLWAFEYPIPIVEVGEGG